MLYVFRVVSACSLALNIFVAIAQFLVDFSESSGNACTLGHSFFFRGRKIYEPPRYLTVSQAAAQFLEIIENRKKSGTEKLGKKA
jgi:hypothetical protein